ncbi:MAG: Tol-Pal system beta propeller repeat protein TolB [Gammaproteobacteria bacterium]|nr:MAG: Tol-Pal system beta propeller repeat protein TolB [Gammaproteobacteria bacterium]
MGLVFLVFAFSFISQSRAELTIEITQGSDRAIPIAVVPFKNNSIRALPEDIVKIIQDDLLRSGEFQPLNAANMLSLPSREKEVTYRDWRLLGQNYIVVGEIEFDSAERRYRVRYELLDVNRQVRLLGKIVKSSEADLRGLAHRISDRIYQAITGVQGIFSTKIAYITLQRKKNGKPEYRLQIADADGQRSQVLFQTSRPILSPAWSPDGKQLAYVSFETTRPAIYIHTLATNEKKLLSAYKGLNGAPAWAPDGQKMVVTLSKDGNAELYQMNLEDGALQRLTRHFAIDTEASWSPDGRELVFTSDRSGKPQIYRMALNNRKPKRLTFDGRYNARPRYSEDGKSIIYVHQSDGVFNIARLALDSGVQTILTDTPLDESPSLAPNGRMLIYGTQRGKSGVLAVVSVDGQTKYFLPSEFGDVREPAWSPYL